MIRNLAGTMLLALLFAANGVAQRTTVDFQPGTARFDIAGGYNLIHANAPPGSCACFTLSGGFVAADINLGDRLTVVAEVTGGHATDISSLGQNLTLGTFAAGPRVSWPHYRFAPFGEFLAGVARGTGSYFPSSTTSSGSASSFAFSTGGGMDVNMAPRVAVRIADVRYFRSFLPNDANGSQNQLQIEAGLVFRLGDRGIRSSSYKPAQERSLQAPETIPLSCTTADQEVVTGRAVHILGNSLLDPSQGMVQFSWSTNGGVVHGDGNAVVIDTANLAPGSYRVDGHAFLAAHQTTTGNCSVSFLVKKFVDPLSDDSGSVARISGDQAMAEDGSKPLQDVFFDYDQTDLRLDAKDRIVKDAEYLKAHPEINLTIAGYADERGSDEYNIALGLERATVTRLALIIAGVAPSRIQILSYGKEKPFCSDDAESCYQLNRRAEFVLDRR